MANILSQDEVDALLRSFQEDETGGTGAGAETDSASAEEPARAGAMQLYDFRRPSRISRDQLRLLHSLHETFALAFSGVLSGNLRTMAEIQVLSLEQLNYAEWIHGLPKSACLFPFSMAPLEGAGVAEISNELVLGIVDRLLGGRGEQTSLLRDPTALETTLIARVIDDGLRVLADAWSEVTRFTPQRRGFEKRPSMLRLLSETEIVLLATLKLKLQHVSGTCSFCYPLVTIEPAIAKLASAFAQGALRQKGATEGRPWMVLGVQEGRIPLSVRLGRGSLSVSEFIRMKPGDVIPLDRGIHEPLPVVIGGKEKLSGRPGMSGKRLAVQICGRA
ncbi:MAG: flagellar motor switch protein FliM [Candidatus Eisenbacteria bacterium]